MTSSSRGILAGVRRVVLAWLVVAAACGDRRDPAPGSARGGPVAAPAAPADAAPPLAPLDDARLDALAAVEVPGWTATARDRSAASLVAQLRAGELRALVTVTPCLRCRPAELEAWREAVPELRALMPGAVEDDPATRFELSAVAVAGRPCVATWELGAIAYGDEVEASHGARVYCNDGTTEVVVRVDDDAVTRAATPEAARAAAASRDALEAAAGAIAAAYLGALTP